MNYKWTDWERIKDDLDPYIHWSLDENPGEDRIFSDNFDKLRDGDNVLQKTSLRLLDDDHWSIFKGLNQIVVPFLARNPHTKGDLEPQRPVIDMLPSGENGDLSTKIGKDTIIAGVIDVGMPLGHKRLRFKNGKTRLLSAWQMVGNWTLSEKKELPFGCEFYEHEINQRLAEFSGGNLTGKLDEDSFHQKLGILNFSQISRQTSLANRASHGAHVLDMVAGAEADDPDFARRVRIIAVNTPSSAVFGASGTFLDSYMLHAIQRIADTADLIWEKKFGEDTVNGLIGFPIVINLSFGKSAGSKDTLDRFAAALLEFQRKRKSDGKSRVDIIMPTGNDNLSRCNAFLKLGAKTPPQLMNWRMQPQDQSSNFVEVWINDRKRNYKHAKSPVKLSLNAPSGRRVNPKEPKGLGKGETIFCALKRDGKVVAHIYLTRVAKRPQIKPGKKATSKEKRREVKYRYVLCATPTYRLDDSDLVAESGLWTIALKNVSQSSIRTLLSVQTDQSISPGRSINRRSYFDDEGYKEYADDGRLLESYSYPKNEAAMYVNLDKQSKTPVRRHGTMNASSAHRAVARIGGYRANDGRPAFYSSTGRGRKNGRDAGVDGMVTDGENSARMPTAAMPTDDGPAHGGILSAGSSDGSRVVMRGTSFASSQAARLMILELLAGGGTNGVECTLEENAVVAEENLRAFGPEILTYHEELIEVIGRGRIPAAQQRGPRRVARGPFDG